MTTTIPRRTEWIGCSIVGSSYEEQIDVLALPGSPNRFRHRRFSADVFEWTPGLAPFLHTHQGQTP